MNGSTHLLPFGIESQFASEQHCFVFWLEAHTNNAIKEVRMLTRRSLITGLAASLAVGPARALACGKEAVGMTSTGAPLRIGSVELVVKNIDLVGEFYKQVIGLSLISIEPRRVRLGVGSTVLLTLRHNPDAELSHFSEAGLFHVAFLFAEREDLGSWLLNAVRLGVPIQGASDHLVSEAIYLSDPEGNGIEMYWDRPRETWSWRDGMVQMATLELDLNGLAEVAQSRIWNGLPESTLVGHVHLQVGSIPEAEKFYSDALGMDIVHRINGASFYSSGGYHHHIATNVWNSRGAGAKRAGTTGLAAIEILLGSQDLVSRVGSQAGAAEISGHHGGFEIVDPWGVTVALRAA